MISFYLLHFRHESSNSNQIYRLHFPDNSLRLFVFPLFIIVWFVFSIPRRLFRVTRGEFPEFMSLSVYFPLVGLFFLFQRLMDSFTIRNAAKLSPKSLQLPFLIFVIFLRFLFLHSTFVLLLLSTNHYCVSFLFVMESFLLFMHMHRSCPQKRLTNEYYVVCFRTCMYGLNGKLNRNIEE